MRTVGFWAAWAVLVAGTGLWALASQEHGPVGTATIDGRVTLDTDGRGTPVRRARVTATSDIASVSADTDVDGRFHLSAVPAGAYHLDVLKFGFVPTMPVLTVVRGADAKTIDIHMQRGAAIEGRIVTSTGQPGIGLVVSAARLGYGAYGRKTVAIQRSVTDDRGHYRLHTLLAGNYYLEVAPDATLVTNVAAIAGETRLPTRTYYSGVPGGGTPKLDEAGVVTVETGQQVSGLDVTVGTGVVTNVNAHVTTSSGAAPASFSFRLQRVGGPSGEQLCYSTSGRGETSASCRNVPPGEYWALASARPAAGPAEFSVSRIAVNGGPGTEVTVATTPGVALAGRVEADGGGPPPPNLRMAALETDFELPNVAPGGGASTPPVRVAADGTFAFASVAGPRVIRAMDLPAGWVVKSVFLGTADITDAPTAFETAGGSPAIRVVLTSATGSLSGAALDAQGHPRAGAHIVVFARDSRLWGARSRFAATAETSTDGRYVVSGLIPGDYFVTERDFMDDGAWMDPLSLGEWQRAAMPVSVTAGATVTLDWRPR